MNQSIKYSNCLIEAIKVRLVNKNSCIGYDFNSPSGGISFYCDTELGRHRFRRKLYRYGNKSKFLFKGYNIVENEDKKK